MYKKESTGSSIVMSNALMNKSRFVAGCVRNFSPAAELACSGNKKQ